MKSTVVHLIDETGEAKCRAKDCTIGVHKDLSRVTCPACLGEVDADLSGIEVTTPHPEPGRQKREPCYKDHDPILFGKHRGEMLCNVPASYLHWLWTKRPLTDRKLENYIFNNIPALKKEFPDGIWT